MCVAWKSRRIMSHWWSIWTSTRRAETHRRRLLLAPFQPALDQGQRPGTFGIRGLFEGGVMVFGNPTLFPSGAVARQRQPHQSGRPLARAIFAIEQDMSEQGLGLVLAFVGRKRQPAHRLT